MDHAERLTGQSQSFARQIIRNYEGQRRSYGGAVAFEATRIPDTRIVIRSAFTG